MMIKLVRLKTTAKKRAFKMIQRMRIVKQHTFRSH
jgi:hypothetical protein